MPAHRLTDGVVVLRPPDRDDLESLVEVVRASRDHLWPWMAWAVEDYGVAHASRFLEDLEEGPDRAFLVRDTDGRLLGVCGLDRVDPLHRTASLGYWLRPEATGRGLATRAAGLVLAHGLRELGLERIEIVTAVTNTASRRVAERLDLSYEGRRRRALRLDGEQQDADVHVAFSPDLAHLLT